MTMTITRSTVLVAQDDAKAAQDALNRDKPLVETQWAPSVISTEPQHSCLTRNKSTVGARRSCPIRSGEEGRKRGLYLSRGGRSEEKEQKKWADGLANTDRRIPSKPNISVSSTRPKLRRCSSKNAVGVVNVVDSNDTNKTVKVGGSPREDAIGHVYETSEVQKLITTTSETQKQYQAPATDVTNDVVKGLNILFKAAIMAPSTIDGAHIQLSKSVRSILRVGNKSSGFCGDRGPSRSSHLQNATSAPEPIESSTSASLHASTTTRPRKGKEPVRSKSKDSLGDLFDVVAYYISSVARISRHRSQRSLSADYRSDSIKRKQTKV
ncbi:MAG: hypothetical protein J3Q66DRAFT_437977, partial [Benniella sp.]